MISSTIGGASLLSYLTTGSTDDASTSNTTAGATSGTTSTAATKAQAQAALASAAKTFRASTAEAALEKRQTALASDLQAAMAKAGVKLSGSVDFTVDSTGKLVANGSDADKAAANAFLKADTSKPGFASRITSLASDSDKLSSSIRQNAAISQAARYGGRGGGVMSLYSSLMQQQDKTPAVFSLSSSASSLTYPGVLAAQA